jgi:hypothetical protein
VLTQESMPPLRRTIADGLELDGMRSLIITRRG